MPLSHENYFPEDTIKKGESKIEKGLREFRIYRVAPNNTLLRLQPKKLYGKKFRSHGSFDELLNRGIFFTTQKNMALEYRLGKSVLLEQKGADFLSDLQKLEDQGIKIVLFSHENLIAYQKLRCTEHNEEDVKRFLVKHTFSPFQVSPRMLRRSAEIIILMPEQLHVLPLDTATIKKQGMQECSLKDHHQKKDRFKPPGQFHERIVEVNRKPDVLLKRLKRKHKKLEAKRSEIFGKMLQTRRYNEKEQYEQQIMEIVQEITSIKEKILARQEKEIK
jgi:hypothetical protein